MMGLGCFLMLIVFVAGVIWPPAGFALAAAGTILWGLVYLANHDSERTDHARPDD